MYNRRYFGFLVLAGSLLLVSCENDLKNVEKISSKKVEVPVDKSFGVEALLSDSAVVKAKLITPELFYFNTEKPYYEMKKGVTIIFYNEDIQEISRVTSDYAIRHENEKLVEFKKNVVVTNINGDTYNSEELIYNETATDFPFYSNQLVKITKHNGRDIGYGSGFKSDASFVTPIIFNARGNITVGDNLLK